MNSCVMETCDRLSELPDDILCNILSFLPTHESIATSLLSKRWRSIWLSVPAVYLDDKSFVCHDRPYSSFIKFGDAVIQRCATACNCLVRFCLNFNLPCSHFKEWVDTILQRGVQHLYISVFYSFKVPCSVWSCRSLVVLDLSRLCAFTLRSVHLPLLKKLRLDYLSMAHNRYFVEILAGSPLLEDLQANHLFCYKKDVVQFQTMPKLVKADISNNPDFNIPLNAVCNVVHLRVHLELNQECFPMFHNLINLELDLGNCIKWSLVFEMLKHCPKLQTLALNKSPSEIWPCPKFVPECVALRLRRCSIVFHKDSELQFVKYIMQNSRAIQTMTISRATQTMTIHNIGSLNAWNNVEVPPELDKLSSFCPKGSATFKLLYKFSIGKFSRLVQFVPE